MKIPQKFKFVEGDIDTEHDRLICVCSRKHLEVELCFKAGMNVPFAKIKLYSRDLAVDAEAVFDGAYELGKLICQRWNSAIEAIGADDGEKYILESDHNAEIARLRAEHAKRRAIWADTVSELNAATSDAIAAGKLAADEIERLRAERNEARRVSTMWHDENRAKAETIRRLEGFAERFAWCPCCESTTKCSDDCTLAKDCPDRAEVMAEARGALDADKATVNYSKNYSATEDRPTDADTDTDGAGSDSGELPARTTTDTEAELVAMLKPFGYAPGHYQKKCHGCALYFTGDKRAVRCQRCATALATAGDHR